MIQRALLEDFAAQIFAGAGMEAAHARTVAQVLVFANLRGVDTHGVSRIAQYVEMIDRGEINPTPALTVISDLPALAVLDADRAAGPVAMVRAVDIAMEKARYAGIGMTLVRGTTHTAALGYYTRRAAESGFAAIALSGSAPLMGYYGALAAGVATNPISIAVPGGVRGPVVLDMASSVIPLGRIFQARRTGEALPPDSAMDKQGRVTTDPHAAAYPLPLGGPKGSGLSLMIECLTSLAVAAPIVSEALEGTEFGRRHRQNASVIAIDLARFGDPQAYAVELQRLEKDLKALPVDPAVSEILMPGERGDREYARRMRAGIDVPAPVLADLQKLARRFGIAAPG